MDDKKTVPVGVRVSVGDLRMIDMLAEAQGKSRSQFIADAARKEVRGCIEGYWQRREDGEIHRSAAFCDVV